MATNPFTFAIKGQPQTGNTGVWPGKGSNFGGMVNDGDNVAIDVASGPMTQDITTPTANTSPQTISSSAATTIQVPLNATKMHITVITNSVNWSEVSSAFTANYWTIPTGIEVIIPVARCATLYFKANSSSATMYFYFEVL